MKLGMSKALGVVHEDLMELDEGGLDNSSCAEKLKTNLNALTLLSPLPSSMHSLFSSLNSRVPLTSSLHISFTLFCNYRSLGVSCILFA